MGDVFGRKVAIAHLDHCPRRIERLSPLLAVVERQLNYDDGNDYYLLKLVQPFFFRKLFRKRSVSHLIICPRWKAGPIDMAHDPLDSVPVNVFLVLDDTVISESRFTHEQIQPLAIGTVSAK
jgi:hypothetical protein